MLKKYIRYIIDRKQIVQKCRIKKLLRCYFMANNKIDFEFGFLVVCLLLDFFFIEIEMVFDWITLQYGMQ